MLKKFFKYEKLNILNIFNIFNLKTDNNLLLFCLFLYFIQSIFFFRIRSPPVLLLDLKTKILNERIGVIKMDKEYYIVINKVKYEISEEIYNIYYKSIEKERYFMFVKNRGKIIIE